MDNFKYVEDIIFDCDFYPFKYEELSEDFIREHQDKVFWPNVFKCKQLSENFIRDFIDKADWYYISKYQRLSEGFIREFRDKVDWIWISACQNLSENFIREFRDKVEWLYISESQILSENFIREFQDKVDWISISKYQQLSKKFILEFKNKFYWDLILKYQKLSEDFFLEINFKVPKTCWLYKTPKWKENYIRKNTDYPIEDGMIIAYKSTLKSGFSTYTPRYKYEVGKEYESTADFNTDISNSFGLSAWIKQGALAHYNAGKLFKVGIKPKDLACVVREANKLRATKIKILEEIL